MANEQEKLDEAEHFLVQMRAAEENVPVFKHSLSAFLTAARSVLQFADNEARGKQGGSAWYRATIAADPVVAFLRDKRDANVHRTPVKVAKDVTIKIGAVLRVSEHISMTVIGADGKVKGTYESKPETLKKKEWVPAETSYKYRFPDWQGEETVPVLCERYLNLLKNIVIEGRQKGFLT